MEGSTLITNIQEPVVQMVSGGFECSTLITNFIQEPVVQSEDGHLSERHS